MRVRQRGENGNYIFIKTTKREIEGDSIRRSEQEELISEKEYSRLLMDADPERVPIRKTRYCLTYKGQYFEIDIYPRWNNQAICEIELREENQQIEWPDFIKQIKEVTDDPQYKNSDLAKSFAAE